MSQQSQGLLPFSKSKPAFARAPEPAKRAIHLFFWALKDAHSLTPILCTEAQLLVGKILENSLMAFLEEDYFIPASV
jgi:hypothetical protein